VFEDLSHGVFFRVDPSDNFVEIPSSCYASISLKNVNVVNVLMAESILNIYLDWLSIEIMTLSSKHFGKLIQIL
jgi:hypothetical protein